MDFFSSYWISPVPFWAGSVFFWRVLLPIAVPTITFLAFAHLYPAIRLLIKKEKLTLTEVQNYKFSGYEKHFYPVVVFVPVFVAVYLTVFPIYTGGKLGGSEPFLIYTISDKAKYEAELCKNNWENAARAQLHGMTPEEFNSKVQSAVDGIGIAVKYINGECVAKVVKDGKPSLVYLYDSELESGLDDAISTISNQYLRFGVVKTKEDMLEQFADVAIPASPVVTFSGTSNTGSLNTCPQTSSK